MNKIIFTGNRLFMAISGLSGSGKTQLLYQMLAQNTFLPRPEKIYLFYQHFQEIYRKMQFEFNLELVPCIDFDMVEKLENCLLIFDDSCEEIYDDKRFVKIATAGRHKNVHVIYVKHNIYHRSKHSKTIDLHNTHLILFKSPRDENQISFLGHQLGDSKFIKACYQKATQDPFGHLLIDFDPKTSDGLRYCSNITGPGPSVFYLPSSKAVTTELTNEREKLGYTQSLRFIQIGVTKAIFGGLH
jgi:hypothetical protein